MIFKHNNIKNLEIRNSNERFNQDYITSLNLDFNIYKYEGFLIGNNDSAPYFTVWLNNIDRLFSLLPKSLFDEYNLIDIGCGLGISINYMKKHYKFNSYSGVDISNDLIKVAKKINENLPINFFTKDAANFFLENKQFVLFMFNPFGFKTLKIFLDNNFKNLKINKSIILYANDLYINEINQIYDVEIIRNNFYNLSVIKF